MSTCILSQGFWKLPHCSKLNRLDAQRHAEVILRALSDVDTQVEQVDRTTYSLAGPSEALLLKSESSVVQMVLLLCSIPAIAQ